MKSHPQARVASFSSAVSETLLSGQHNSYQIDDMSKNAGWENWEAFTICKNLVVQFRFHKIFA